MRKALCVILAFVLCLALFAACGTNKKDSSSSKPAVSSSKPMSSSSMMTDSMTGDSSVGSSGMTGESGMTGSSLTNNQGASVAAMAATEALWFARIVNAANPLPEDFTVETRSIKGYDERLFDVRAADALEAMLSAAEASGNQLYLVSGYRSIARQKARFTRKTNYYISQGLGQAEAEDKASQWVARPGTSEHNLGLAADIVSANWYQTHSDLTQDFDQTPAYTWLEAHAAEYGFILRYPEGKESITGVVYEPWHYRYVGTELAQRLYADKLTLEEYKTAPGV